MNEVDAAAEVMHRYSFVIHPIAAEEIKDAVYKMLLALKQKKAAERWLEPPAQAPATTPY